MIDLRTWYHFFYEFDGRIARQHYARRHPSPEHAVEHLERERDRLSAESEDYFLIYVGAFRDSASHREFAWLGGCDRLNWYRTFFARQEDRCSRQDVVNNVHFRRVRRC